MRMSVTMLMILSLGGAQAAVVQESAREIPVVADVDVVVVGGSSGAVAAAVGAAEQGARVFLAAPRRYLGEDLCGTYRLWLEPNEIPTGPFEEALFAEPTPAAAARPGLPFTYTASRAPNPRHPDSGAGDRLRDGRWQSAAQQSVQYDGEVTISLRLAEPSLVEQVVLRYYRRPGDFTVARATVQVPGTRAPWRALAVVRPPDTTTGAESRAAELVLPVNMTVAELRLVLETGPQATRILLGEIAVQGPPGPEPPAAARRVPPRPLQVKQTLDEALLAAGVRFLYDCGVSELLRDAAGRPAGVVVVNRSGRVAIRAKTVIDATRLAAVARGAGVPFVLRREPVGPASRVVIGGRAGGPDGDTARALSPPVAAHEGQAYTAYVTELNLAWLDADWASLMRLEQVARDRTWRSGQVDAAERVFFVPRTRIGGAEPAVTTWPGPAAVSLEAFVAPGAAGLFVLGGCADLSVGAARACLRPLALVRTGRRVGQRAARVAAATEVSPPVRVAVRQGGAAPVAGTVGEDPDAAPRTGTVRDYVACGENDLPVLGRYDVVVVGGGTGGAPAGIAAARLGAKTLVVEALHGLGGVGTEGLITKYYHGNRTGFTTEIDEGLGQLGGPEEAQSATGKAWDPQLKSEWLRRELRRAGADLWYGTWGCGAVTRGGTVTGVVVATDLGRGVVLARTVIDATGNAGIAAAAGAPCTYTGGGHIAVQGTGLPPRQLGVRYTNTDYTFVDDLDPADTWRLFVTSKAKFAGAYDLGQLIDTRERRQIQGDLTLTPMDVYLGRTYPDTIVRANSNFDSHGFTVHPMFMLRPPDRESLPTNVPYRCLLPRGLEGILVTGLGVSAHRDVMPVIRMQPDVQNQGYAAGAAAAMAVARGCTLREIDLRQLQAHLVRKGILREATLHERDSFPPTPAAVAAAVRDVVHDFNGLEVLFAVPERAQPLLHAAYGAAESGADKLVYARILAFLGDAVGTPELVATVRANAWDEGWAYRGMGQFGRSVSVLDSMLIALGCTGRAEAVTPLAEKIRELGPGQPFSHHRAVAMAAEMLRRPALAPALAAVLRKPGMGGHAFTDLAAAQGAIQASRTDNSTRESSLRELVLARALFRCGDYEGLGRATLEAYARDLRGHYRRHAQAVLAEGPN